MNARTSSSDKRGPTASIRLRGALHPLSTKLLRNLFMRDQLARIRVVKTGLELLDDVQVVNNVLQTAVVRKLVQKSPDRLLRRLHA